MGRGEKGKAWEIISYSIGILIQLTKTFPWCTFNTNGITAESA